MTITELHADFSEPVVLHTESLPWQASPAPGVERRMLDRIGGEVARATSIVRYAPNSRFDPHVHGAGEEFLVLEGVFSDEHGDYPTGTYVRNPWGTSHAPFTASGCAIFVKLRQMDPADQRQTVIMADGPPDGSGPGDGMARKLLHVFKREVVTYETWTDGASPGSVTLPGGAEMLILAGTLRDGGTVHPTGTWLRFPPGATLVPQAQGQTRFWMKRGHLASTAQPAQ